MASDIFRAIRDRKPCHLIQKVDGAGMPICVSCGKRVPANYLSHWKGKKTGGLFCTDNCAITWAGLAARTVYMRQIADGTHEAPTVDHLLEEVKKRARPRHVACVCGDSRVMHVSGTGACQTELCDCKKWRAGQEYTLPRTSGTGGGR